ncbi:MAG: hypothetical protein K6T75_04225 [Acetobacteraceae bacterium]|nr:hypothetical protein [Acetobacteraceae bacterium]
MRSRWSKAAAWWRGHRLVAGILALTLALALALGSAASAQSQGGSDPGDAARAPWASGGRWGSQGAGGGESQDGPPGALCGPGRMHRARLFLALCRYLDMEPRQLWDLLKQHGRARVVMGAPLAKLSGKPLEGILAAREETGSWTSVIQRLDVEPDDYLLELERLLGVGRRPPGQGAQGDGAGLEPDEGEPGPEPGDED